MQITYTHTHRSEGYIAKKSIAKRRQDNEEPACNARVSVEFLSLRVLFCRPGFGKTKGVGGVSVKTVSLYTSLLNNQRQSSLSFESIINGVCELHLLIHVLITFVAKKETYNARRFSHRKKEGSKWLKGPIRLTVTGGITFHAERDRQDSFAFHVDFNTDSSSSPSSSRESWSFRRKIQNDSQRDGGEDLHNNQKGIEENDQTRKWCLFLWDSGKKRNDRKGSFSMYDQDCFVFDSRNWNHSDSRKWKLEEANVIWR